MQKQCIRCGKVWDSALGNSADGLKSHGLCLDCLLERLTPLFRNRQIAEGNPDCFGKALGHCERKDCSYFDLCVKGIVGSPVS